MASGEDQVIRMHLSIVVEQRKGGVAPLHRIMLLQKNSLYQYKSS